MSKTPRLSLSPPAKPADSTEDLVIKARVGDRSAENEIVRRNLPRLRRFAHGRLPARLRNGCDTEDIVQDSMLKTLRRLPTFDTTQPGGLQAYLRTAIQNRVRDEYRRRPTHGSSEGLTELVDKGPSPFDRAREQEVAERQQAVLSLLRPGDRALLVARIDMGYNYEQLARLFGKPTPNAARVALHRALRRAIEAASTLSTPRRK